MYIFWGCVKAYFQFREASSIIEPIWHVLLYIGDLLLSFFSSCFSGSLGLAGLVIRCLENLPR